MATTTGHDLRVPAIPLGRQVEQERAQLETAVTQVLESGRYLLGEQLSGFEAEFAAALGGEPMRATGVASGAHAIEIALRALGVGPDDEVVTQANTCLPTVDAIVRSGARPVLCDVEPEGGTIDPDSLRAAIGRRTRAVVPVHLYGQCADMVAVRAVAEERGLAVVEDCAQAHGADYGGRPAGTMGELAAFSFYPTKNLGALGDAGAVVTGDDGLADAVRRLARGSAASAGRMDEVQAAVLRVRLPRLQAANRRRARIAERYDAALEGTPARPLRRFDGRLHARHQYVVRAPGREGFRSAMVRRGVETLAHYERPVHHHEDYRELARGPVPLEHSERLAESVVSLPVHPALTDDEVELAVQAAREAALESEGS
jgi:dTDP-4-amino-4,6-dideoxygalactose transaminase